MADLIEGNPNAEIRAAYKPSEKEHGLLRFVYQRYSDMKATRSKFEPIWDRHEKQWEAWRPPKNINDWQSNIVPPFTTSIVEAELSELIDQTLRPKASARGPEDKPKATVINHVMEYTWELGDGDIELYKANDCIRRYILDFEKFKTVYKGKIFDPLGNTKYVKPGGDTNYYEFYQE